MHISYAHNIQSAKVQLFFETTKQIIKYVMFFLSFGLDWIAQSKQLIVELKKTIILFASMQKKQYLCALICVVVRSNENLLW